MTFSPRLRGAAVFLSFVVLAVTRAWAVPNTQDFNFSGSASGYGSFANAGVGTTWVPTAPSSSLSSLTLDLTFSSYVSATNVNPFDSTQMWNVFIDWAPSIYVFLPDGSTPTVFRPDQIISKSGMVSSGGSISTDGTFTDTIHLTFYTPSLLGPDQIKFIINSGARLGTQYGSGFQNATITGTLTYNVPEITATLALLVPTILAAFVLHHRIRRRRELAG